MTTEETDGKTEQKEETLNSRQAIWLRAKSEVKPEEYNDFYRQISHDTEDPLKTIHVAAEGGAVDSNLSPFLYWPEIEVNLKFEAE